MDKTPTVRVKLKADRNEDIILVPKIVQRGRQSISPFFHYIKRACVDTKLNEGYEHTERYYSQALQTPHFHSNLALLSFPRGGKFCTEPL